MGNKFPRSVNCCVRDSDVGKCTGTAGGSNSKIPNAIDRTIIDNVVAVFCSGTGCLTSHDASQYFHGTVFESYLTYCCCKAGIEKVIRVVACIAGTASLYDKVFKHERVNY